MPQNVEPIQNLNLFNFLFQKPTIQLQKAFSRHNTTVHKIMVKDFINFLFIPYCTIQFNYGKSKLGLISNIKVRYCCEIVSKPKPLFYK